MNGRVVCEGNGTVLDYCRGDVGVVGKVGNGRKRGSET